jgi:hypothetical protein
MKRKLQCKTVLKHAGEMKHWKGRWSKTWSQPVSTQPFYTSHDPQTFIQVHLKDEPPFGYVGERGSAWRNQTKSGSWEEGHAGRFFAQQCRVSNPIHVLHNSLLWLPLTHDSPLWAKIPAGSSPVWAKSPASRFFLATPWFCFIPPTPPSQIIWNLHTFKQVARHIMALPFKWRPKGWWIFNILNWKHMMVSMVNKKWILQLCWTFFYSGLHMTLKRRDTKLWPVSGCIAMSLPWRAEPIKT